MWNAELQGRVVRRATLPFTFRIPHSAFRIYFARRSSTISQIRCSMARWISWIRAVSSEGTISTTSVRSLSRPPECPRKPTTVTARAFAACAPRITLGLSPLVVLVSVVGVGYLLGAVYVLIAIPIASVIATLVDVVVRDRDPAEEESPTVLFAGTAEGKN